jgi:hypothetical protein
MSWLIVGNFDNSSGVEAAQKLEDNNNNRRKIAVAGRRLLSSAEKPHPPVKVNNVEIHNPMSRLPGVDAMLSPRKTRMMRSGITYTVTPTFCRSLVRIRPRKTCWKPLFLLFDNVGVDGVDVCCP